MKRNATGERATVTFTVQQPRLSCLQIRTCCERGEEKKLIFPIQIRKGNICWSGLQTRERESTDMDQQAGDVSDIQMYIWR